MKLKGTFNPPGDKGISHRIALFSLLAQGDCRVSNYAPGEDCASTIAAVKLLGGDVQFDSRGLLLRGVQGRLRPAGLIGCQNSGTTMRLLMGIVAGVSGVFGLDGDESLRRRPMERVAEPLRQMGAGVETSAGRPPVRITGGGLKGINYTLPVASAQLKSAVMLAGIQAEGITTVVEPTVSRDHTERLLAQCQADISRQDGAWRIKPSRLMLPDSLFVPGDISSAAFFLCAAAMVPGSEVTAKNVLLNPTRNQFLEVLKRMGALVEVDLQSERPEPCGDAHVRHNPGLKACEIMAQEIPLLVDEVPILALVATQAQGTTVFRQVGELRVKESDRLAAIVSQLGLMGAQARIEGDDLAVTGPTALAAPSELEGFGDHRMAMMLRLAGLVAGGQPHINGEECVAVSYPGFHHTLKRLVQ